MAICPAYHISLTAAEKRLVAEVSAIQSQIEWLMRLVVQHLLAVTPESAQTIMGSTSIETNAAIWISVVREKLSNDAAKEWAERAYSGVKDLAKGRNDFLHTLYGFSTEGDMHEDEMGPIGFTYGHRTPVRRRKVKNLGIRVKTSALVPLQNLRQFRDDAAKLSVIFAHVEASASPHDQTGAPWIRRLGSKRPPPFQTAKPKKGTAPAPPLVA